MVPLARLARQLLPQAGGCSLELDIVEAEWAVSNEKQLEIKNQGLLCYNVSVANKQSDHEWHHYESKAISRVG